MAHESDPEKKAVPAAPIPDDLWNLPVSFTTGGEPVSLRDYLRPTVPVLPVSQLTPEQWVALAARRIELQPGYRMTVLGHGTLDQRRALVEVRGRSPIGRVLVEIEQRLITDLIAHAPPL
jgi:hypothetical protein